MSVLRVLGVAVCALLTHAVVRAQPPAPGRVKIWTAGAFLGQIEGFCEDPGGEYDWPPALNARLVKCGPDNPPTESQNRRDSRWLGGVLGVRGLLADKAAVPEDLVIISPNNQVPGFTTGSSRTAGWRQSPFWDLLASLAPDVVAIGPEDFFRSIRAPLGSARDLRDFVQNKSQIPLLATNVAIRETADGISEAEFKTDGYDFHVDDDQSRGWLEPIKVEHPEGATLGAELQEFAYRATRPDESEEGADYDGTVEVEPGKDGNDGTIKFPVGLRPNRWYRLLLKDGTNRKASLLFRTDAALTPVAGNRPLLAGFPAYTEKNSPYVVVSMIDPGTRSGAGNKAWKWKEGEKAYEMLFTDPGKTLQALRERAVVKTKVANKKEEVQPPIVVLVSSLTDDDTLALLDKATDVRVVILTPESQLLARASQTESRGGTRYAGDLGLAATFDAHTQQATKLVVRPEWLGETLFKIQAHLTLTDEGLWQMQPGHSVEHDVVPGAALETSLQDGHVTYTARYRNTGTVTPLERLPYYRNCAFGSVGRCANFRKLWTDQSDLAALVGDALRRDSRADLAIVSKDIIDADYLGYVERRVNDPKTRENTGWISRYILERLIYTSPRIVTAYVSGSSLLATLQKAIKDDDSLCVSGIAASCPTKIDADHPEQFKVNDRNINPHLVYRIALPDALAESLELNHNDTQSTVDVIESAHRHLAENRWDVSAGEQPVGDALESRRNGHWQGYWALPTLDLGVAKVTLPDDDIPSVRKNLGVSFGGAEEHRTTTIDIESDLAPIDYPRWAVRFPTTVKYSRRKEEDEVTYDNDDVSFGGRVDLKLGWLRPYAGYFIEGNWKDRPSPLRASRELPEPPRDGFTGTETAGFETAFTVEPRRFRHAAVGVDAFEGLTQNVGKVALVLKRLGVRLAHGSESNVPTAIAIGDATTLGETPLLDVLLSAGAQGMLNQYFKANPDTFSRADEIRITRERVDQDRLQADVELLAKYKFRTKEYTTEAKWRFRWYDSAGAAISPFLLSREDRLELKASAPLVWRLKVTATYEAERAEIEGSAVNTNSDQAVNRFKYRKFDVKLSMPLMIRIKKGLFVR